MSNFQQSILVVNIFLLVIFFAGHGHVFMFLCWSCFFCWSLIGHVLSTKSSQKWTIFRMNQTYLFTYLVSTIFSSLLQQSTLGKQNRTRNLNLGWLTCEPKSVLEIWTVLLLPTHQTKQCPTTVVPSPTSNLKTNVFIQHYARVSKLNMSRFDRDLNSQFKKRQRSIPLLKAGKSPSEVASFRPISLTSCVAKLLERILADRLYYITETKNLFSRFQAGFWKGKSREDQITRIVQAIEDGFHQRPMQRSLLTLLDFSKAYDTVWRQKLLLHMLRYSYSSYIHPMDSIFFQRPQSTCSTL